MKLTLTSKRAVTILVGVVAAGLALNAGRLLKARTFRQAPAPRSPAPTVAATPYLVLLSGAGSNSSSPQVGLVRTIAVRSDGSSLLRAELFNGNAPLSQRLIRFVTGQIIVTNDIQETRTTLSRADIRPAAILRDPTSNCLSSYASEPQGRRQAVLGHEQLLGYRTVKIREDDWVYWFAVDLGCAELRVRSPQIAGGGDDAVLVRPGEPPPELFRVPPHYREVSQGEMAGR